MNSDLYQHYLENPDDQPYLHIRRMDRMPSVDGGALMMGNVKRYKPINRFAPVPGTKEENEYWEKWHGKNNVDEE